MAINNNDVKLFESQRLTDEEDGGGRVTGREVQDGDINNLYRDISRIDRTIGDVALRKAFIGINTDNNDAYLGSHIILTEPPKDENVSVLLFNTDDQTDERNNARDRIEGYVVPGTVANWEFIGNQLEGQRSVLGIQREEQRIPEIGEVFRVYDPLTQDEQYLRITSVDHSLETFTYDKGNNNFDFFDRRKLELEVSAPLKKSFPGGTPTPGATEGEKSEIYTTQVADTSRYYGIQSLSADISQGDLTLKVNSVYLPLVPSAKVESPLLDQYGGYTAKNLVATSESTRNISCSFVHVGSNQSRSYLQRGALPQSVTLVIESGTFEDDGTGNFIHKSGANNFSKLTIDYETGELNVWRTSSYFTSTASATYQPAVGITGAAISGTLEVTNQNRGFNYTFNFAEAKPRPGTLVISYIALGKWQEVRDTGNGQLDGSGTGNILFDTGTVAITLDGLPDPDSAIVYSYVTQADDEVVIRTGSVAVEKFTYRHTTEKPGIKPGSVVIKYLVNEQETTLTDQGNGLLSGSGSGSIHYAPGEMSFSLSSLPDAGSEIEISYSQGEQAGGVVGVSVDGGGLMSGTIPGAPLLPGSVSLLFAVERDQNTPHYYDYGKLNTYTTTYQVNKTATDDASGNWRIGEKSIVGGIDYQTGFFTIQALDNYSYYEYQLDKLFNGYEVSSATTTRTEIFSGNSVTATVQSNDLVHDEYTETLPRPELTIDLLPLIEDPLLPGSVVFSWNGETYFDRDGQIFKEISTQTNAGVQVGTVDYTGGLVTLASYPSGNLASANIQAAATISGGFTVDAVAFRTAGSPVRLGSLQLTAMRADNAEIITATADFNGEINTAEVQGKIDTTTGWCEIDFTDGTDPIGVIPQSIRYNCIVETSLPLDAELIGLDPVRLPPDGKVPIYRQGDIVVISHTDSTDAGTPTAGQDFVLLRNHQAEITVEDSNGNLLDPAQYTTDREAGTITFADPLLLQDAEGISLSAPYTIKDRVEHMSVVSDVQINGDLSIIAPVPWDLPAAETSVSSAIVYGDLQARIHHFYTQKVWDSGEPNWTDYPQGESTTAQYNQINYPIQVSNKGAIYGKWALIFTSSTAFQVVEEKLGIIDTGNTSVDTAPINPETGVPYFTILADGWGSGWSTGNNVRFNTDGCLAPVWICRTVLAGQGTETNDRFTIQIRGDAD